MSQAPGAQRRRAAARRAPDGPRGSASSTDALVSQTAGAVELLVARLDATAGEGRRPFDEAVAVGEDHAYRGLLSVGLRLLFLLYAEDLGLLPAADRRYGERFGVRALAEGLRAEADARPGSLAGRCGAWARLLSTFRAVWAGAPDAASALRARGGVLFDPDAFPFLEGRRLGEAAGAAARPPEVDDDTVLRMLERLVRFEGRPVSYADLEVEQLGGVYEVLMGYHLARRGDRLRIEPGAERRRTSSHYTPSALATVVVRRTLEPLLAELGPEPSSDALLSLRVCDPSMGSGAFLLQACRFLADQVTAAWERERARVPPGDDGRVSTLRARRLVAERCLHGVDKNPTAVELAKLSLWLLTEARDQPFSFLDRTLRHGDSLLGVMNGPLRAFSWSTSGRVAPCAGLADRHAASPTPDAYARARLVGDLLLGALFEPGGAGARDHAREARLELLRRWSEGDADLAGALATLAEAARARAPLFHWELELPDVFPRGFDAVLGNPPWILYAGRGKQPIAPHEEAALKALFGRAGSTLSTHGCFAARAAALVRDGGRVGLVLPTSMADATRYAEARAAHDSHCDVERDLPDFGDGAFAGVFQPSFALLSTRRPRALGPRPSSGAAWRLERRGPEDVLRVLDKLDARPKLPPELFGERGYRSSKSEAGAFRRCGAPEGPYTVPLYEGTSVREHHLEPPTAYADPVALPRVARPETWRAVDVFIRQTARFPIACLGARAAFRNSVLAGFARPPWTAHGLTAYLNSAPVRFYHFHKQRDAQQGMPQVKIGHLRMLPAPREDALAELDRLGRQLSDAGSTGRRDQTALDLLVARTLDLSDAEARALHAWGLANPPPTPKRGRGPASAAPASTRRAGGRAPTSPHDARAARE